jgi:acyl carrier protein
MEKFEILVVIRKEIHALFQIPEESITSESRLYEDLDLDSIDAIDLIVRLQSIANKRISPDQFKSVVTVEDVVTVIEDLMRD